MEMKEVSVEVKGKEEQVKGKEVDIEEAKPTREAKTEEEADIYSKLKASSEDVYSEAYLAGRVKPKAGKQAEGNTRLYRAVSAFLTVICLILVLVVIILSMKLQAGSCPEREEVSTTDQRVPLYGPACSLQQCQDHFNIQNKHCRCSPGWVPFGESCFFLSTYRLSWDESKRNCSDKGGSLAVISSPKVQSFLTKEGNMKYWIGLRENRNTWAWVNNTVLRQSYWQGDPSGGDCGIINSENPDQNNWFSADCKAYTYFICQLQA